MKKLLSILFVLATWPAWAAAKVQYNSRAPAGSIARCGDGTTQLVERDYEGCKGHGGVVSWREVN